MRHSFLQNTVSWLYKGPLKRPFRALLHRLLRGDVRIWTGSLRGKWFEGGLAQKLGVYERPIEAVIQKHLKQGDVFFDVGANIGYFSLLATHITGETGHVYCFEPLPENVSAINHNMKINDMTSFTIVNKALSDTIGVAQFSVGDGTRSSLLLTESGSQIEVALTTIDEILKTARFPQLVKIDVEGAEKNVLLGATSLIHNAHSPIFIIEIHDERNQVAVNEILSNAGYKIQKLVADVPRSTDYPFHIIAQK